MINIDLLAKANNLGLSDRATKRPHYIYVVLFVSTLYIHSYIGLTYVASHPMTRTHDYAVIARRWSKKNRQ